MASDEIGFTILDKHALKKFRNYDNKVEYEQFAYIPPRIWLYQVKRLEACLDDFVLNQTNIQRAFAELLVVYEKYPTNKQNIINSIIFIISFLIIEYYLLFFLLCH